MRIYLRLLLVAALMVTALCLSQESTSEAIALNQNPGVIVNVQPPFSILPTSTGDQILSVRLLEYSEFHHSHTNLLKYAHTYLSCRFTHLMFHMKGDYSNRKPGIIKKAGHLLHRYSRSEDPVTL